MMFVWWAVFFFTGALFPSCAVGAPAALGALLLATDKGRIPSANRSRLLITCASGMFVLVTASLSPIDKALLSGSAGPSVFRVAELASPVKAVRERFLTITENRELHEETKGLLRALLVADRSGLSTKTRSDWRNTGTAHYLALSGLHLGLIAVPLFGILTLAGARGIIRDLTTILALSFYASVAGCPGSLLRALSMMTVMRAYRLAGIRICLARCVFAGAFLVCILNPRSLKNAGFLLSFNAAAGVALLGAPVCRSIQHRIAGRRGSRVILPMMLALAMSLSVQISMLPLSVRIFGFAPLAGPMMSVIMALPVTALLYGGLIYVIAGYIWSSITSISLNLIAALTGILVSHGAEISNAGLIVTDFDARLYVPGLALCAIALKSGRKGREILIVGLALSIASFYPAITGRMDGNGETARLPDHGGILYGGNGGVLVLAQWPEARSAPYLVRDVRRAGARRIDVLVIIDPGDFDAEGITSLVRDLGPESILVSPWYDGPDQGMTQYIAVSADTLLITGNTRLAVHAPEILPGRGVRAHWMEACLVISPLD